MILIPITQIRRDGGTQSRAAISAETVAEYAHDMSGDGWKRFPAITVFHDGSAYWLVDGFTRLAAAEQRGLTEFHAEVVQGTHEEAKWESYGVNGTHGLRRTNQDKEIAVKAALMHPRSKGMSDADIASHVRVSGPTVAKYRRELIAAGQLQEETKRTTKDGRLMDTSNIGRKATEPEPAAPALTQIVDARGEVIRRNMHVQLATGEVGGVIGLNLSTGQINVAMPDATSRFVLGTDVTIYAEQKQFIQDEPEPVATPQTHTVTDEYLIKRHDCVRLPTGHYGDVIGFVGDFIDVRTINGMRRINRRHVKLHFYKTGDRVIHREKRFVATIVKALNNGVLMFKTDGYDTVATGNRGEFDPHIDPQPEPVPASPTLQQQQHRQGLACAYCKFAAGYTTDDDLIEARLQLEQHYKTAHPVEHERSLQHRRAQQEQRQAEQQQQSHDQRLTALATRINYRLLEIEETIREMAEFDAYEAAQYAGHYLKLRQLAMTGMNAEFNLSLGDILRPEPVT